MFLEQLLGLLRDLLLVDHLLDLLQVFAGECMCMSLFEFAYLGFEEKWDFLLLV